MNTFLRLISLCLPPLALLYANSNLFAAALLPSSASLITLATTYDSLDSDLSTYAATFPIGSFSSVDLTLMGNFCIDYNDPNMDPLLVNPIYSSHFFTFHACQWFVKDNTTVIDIGAQSGGYALGFSNTASNLTVYAFEHSLFQFTQLLINQHIQNRPNVTLRRIGLSDVSGWVNPGSGYPNKNGTVFASRASGLVQIVPLDSFALTNVSFIKINASGSELDVLHGAQTTISNNLPSILITFYGGTIDYNNTDSVTKAYVDSCITFLNGLGYTNIIINPSSFLFLTGHSFP